MTTITVEIELDGVWTDISSYVRYESRIAITRGRSAEASDADPATCQLTLTNTDGRFSPRNPTGAYYGSLTRNTPIRVSKTVDAVQYFRFHGEVSEWPPTSDISGKNVLVPIQASGVLRRLQAGTPPSRSTMFRQLTNPARLHTLAYWPCEDAAASTTIASGLPGKPAMRITGAPELGSNTQWTASSALPVMKTGVFTGQVQAGTATGDVMVRMFMFVDDPVPANTSLLTLKTTGTAPLWDVQLTTSGGLRTRAYEDETETGTALVDDTTAFSLNSLGFVLVDLRLHQSGANIVASTIVWDFNNTDEINNDSLNETSADMSVSSRTVGRPVAVSVNSGGGLGNVILGHIMVVDDQNAFSDDDPAIFAYNGELAADRIDRLCTEENLTSVLSGSDTDNVMTLGDQNPSTLVELWREAAAADLGVLYEPRDSLGVGYRRRADLYNQTAALTLDYASHELADALKSVDDDQAITNDMAVTRIDGASARVELTDGALSTQDPPDGAGRYAGTAEISAQEDLMMVDQAGWRLHLGTVDEARFPTLSLQLAHESFTGDADLMADALNLELGDRIVIQNPPSWVARDDISLLVDGYTETFDQFLHDITLNCSPESPWQVAVEDTDHYGTSGSTLAADVTSGATSLSVATTGASAGTISDVAFVASAATLNSTATDNVVVSKPTGTLEGHVMVARVGLISQVTITAPSGWTLIGTQDAGVSTRYAAYWKVAGASEPSSYTWTWTGNLFKNSGAIVTYSSVDTTTPIADSDSNGTNVAGTSFATDAVDVPEGGILAVSVFERHSFTGSTTTWTNAADTERLDHGTNGGSGQDISHASYTSTAQGSATSLSRTLTASQSVSQVATWAIALNPVVAAAAAAPPLWTTNADDFPFDLMIEGERITVTAITGTTSPQTFTVTRAVNGITKSHASGAAVTLFKKAVRAL